jgi:hypothetical protein
MAGWKPETGFLRNRWQGYNEALILYVLGLGSPTHSLPEKSYLTWTSTYRWKKLYGHEFLYGASLFMHQLSHVWIDFRGIQDAFMRTSIRCPMILQRQWAHAGASAWMAHSKLSNVCEPSMVTTWNALS